MLLGLTLAFCGWLPGIYAANVRVVSTLAGGGYNNGVTVGTDGSLYLTLYGPGSTIQRVSPVNGQATILYTQPGEPWLRGPLLQAGDGNFYGVIQQTDFYTLGEIFQLPPN